jgi:hypothetical protein
MDIRQWRNGRVVEAGVAMLGGCHRVSSARRACADHKEWPRDRKTLRDFGEGRRGARRR